MKKIDMNSEKYEKELMNRMKTKIKKLKNGCWEWLGCTKQGNYGVIRAKRRNYLVHRLMFELYLKEDIQGKYVCHRCDNPICCNPQHMFIGSQTENMKDAVLKKRMKYGEDHYARKLCEDDVIKIRKMRNTGLSFRKIAEKFLVSYSCITGIIWGKTWKNLIEVSYQ